MGWIGFYGGDNIVLGSMAVVVTSQAIRAVFKDSLMSHSYLLVLFICFCLLVLCMLTILSRVCVMKAKMGKTPVWKIKDLDSESSDDEKEDRESEPKTKFFQLVKARRIYELIYKTGIVFIIAAILLEGLSVLYDPSLKRDFDASAIMLVISGVFLLLLVYVVADTPRSRPSIKYAYRPFDEFIRVPMTVFVPKMFLHLASNLPKVSGILIYQFSAIYSLVTMRRMPQEQIKKFIKLTEFSEIHAAMVTGLILANVCGVLLILGNLAAARDYVKEDLLLTFEKNWRWNIAALDFLLPDIEVESLEELGKAFLEKSQKKDLTLAEKKAVRYIQRPLWKSKRPFIGNRELDGIPEVLRNPKTEDAQPSTSKSTQGPQPEEPQPSSSAQRPLRVG